MLSVKSDRPLGIYLLVAWMVINILILALLIPGDVEDINNYIELILWIVSIPALLVMRKAGAAFSIAVLCITLSTSMGIMLLAYYEGLLTQPVFYINAFRMLLNITAVVYLFKLVFANKFK